VRRQFGSPRASFEAGERQGLIAAAKSLLLPRPHRSPDPHQAEREPHPAAPRSAAALASPARKTRLGRAPAVGASHRLRREEDRGPPRGPEKWRRSAGRSFSISTPPGWARQDLSRPQARSQTGRVRRNPGSRKGLDLEETGAPIEQAIEAYRQVLELNPGAAGALVNLGTIHYRQPSFPKPRVLHGSHRGRPQLPSGQFNLATLRRARPHQRGI